MGTSQASSGPGPGVPLVPPWADPGPETDATTPDGDETAPTAQSQVEPAIAPPARFGRARSSAGRFAESGRRDDLRKALSHYVRTGYGGSATTARRMSSTVRTAVALNSVLGGSPVSGVTREPVDRPIAGASADEIMDSVVDAVRPVDGTLDGEANRDAVRDSLCELLERFPDADLMELTEEQRTLVVAEYVAHDVFRRFDLDIGATIRRRAPSISAALSRLNEARRYIQEVVRGAFRRLARVGHALTSGRIGAVVRAALREAFDVFASEPE